MKFLRIPIMFALTVVALLLAQGCKSTLPGNDPVLVDGERSMQVSFGTLDALLKAEYDNRVALKTVNVDAKHIADQLRSRGPAALTSLCDALMAYTGSPKGSDTSNLQTWLSTVESLARDAPTIFAAKRPMASLSAGDISSILQVLLQLGQAIPDIIGSANNQTQLVMTDLAAFKNRM